MAGIEQLEVHSKSYIVRWVKVDEGDTLSWSVQPHKKSINFGIVKHPGSGATLVSNVGNEPGDSQQTQGSSGRSTRKESTAQDLLTNKGFIPIKWCGRCEADKVLMDTHDVPAGQGGMYGLVFDNTFSKQTSKHATFVVLTYPTGQPPLGTAHFPNQQVQSPGLSESAPVLTPGAEQAALSQDSLNNNTNEGNRPRSVSNRSDGGGGSGYYHVGTLMKRRRKKGQGYARRYFSLDYSTCTLSYYYNRNSSALRGAIPLSLAAVAADERRREITIDSGAEVWHLRVPNDKEFMEWARALERASRVARGLEIIGKPVRPGGLSPLGTRKVPTLHQANPEEDAEWQQVETLVSRVVGTRDALRRLTREVSVSPKAPSGQHLSPGSAHSHDDQNDGYFGTATEKKGFWKRKSSTSMLSPMQQATGAALAVPVPGAALATSPNKENVSKRRTKGTTAGEEKSLSDHCQSLLTDLDSVVAEFTSLITNSKHRRMPPPMSAGAASRMSIETTSTAEEFFDAEDAESNMIKIDGSEGEEDTPGTRGEEDSLHETSSVSSVGEDDATGPDGLGHLFPVKPKSLGPMPQIEPIKRRLTIPQATVPPPSLIAFARKNVGKDFSTISMPVSANEPLSILQKVAEQVEYSHLLDHAAKEKDTVQRLLYVTAFAVSQFSSGRTKERAIRKPFNPLLGETFELVRSEDEIPGGLRLLVEKVQHRPVKLAMHADSAHWSFSQSPTPTQKFWGKSAEITTEGRVRVVLRLEQGGDELYSWNIATMFLRNIVMGEKYVEPVGSMSVVNDSTGHKASVEFRSKGMFGGRVEDVHVDTYGPDGKSTGSGLTGTWTTGLRPTNSGKPSGDEIWKVGQLVDNAAQTYGFTQFAAILNELTSNEKDKLPPTDTRLRPDQRLTEEGNLDDAEQWKQNLEVAQRARRKEMEDKGESWQPRWFVKADGAPEGEEVWKMKTGKDSYWEERAKGEWTGVVDIFNVEKS